MTAISDHVMLVVGLLVIVAILAGLLSARIGAPLLLAFIGIGMLAGEEGPGGITFDDFGTAYIVGSFALAVILFEGGAATEREMLRVAKWPALAMATVGVAVCAAIVGFAVAVVFGIPWSNALLLGACTAPTDAAAVSTLLRLSGVTLPARVAAVLEVELGLNDPMSVLLTVALVEHIAHPAATTLGHLAMLFGWELGGGAVFGAIGGFGLLWLLRRLKMEVEVLPVLALGGALVIFGAAQSLGASGFLAVYAAGYILGDQPHPASRSLVAFFRPLGWLAQICLFLMLGLLVNPSQLLPLIPPALAVTAVLILAARPAAAAICLLPFGWSVRESAFVAWVGLRGAVPIYLTLIPVLAGARRGETLFSVVFVTVIVSVAVQGWTIGPAARLARMRPDPVRDTDFELDPT